MQRVHDRERAVAMDSCQHDRVLTEVDRDRPSGRRPPVPVRAVREADPGHYGVSLEKPGIYGAGWSAGEVTEGAPVALGKLRHGPLVDAEAPGDSAAVGAAHEAELGIAPDLVRAPAPRIERTTAGDARLQLALAGVNADRLEQDRQSGRLAVVSLDLPARRSADHRGDRTPGHLDDAPIRAQPLGGAK